MNRRMLLLLAVVAMLVIATSWLSRKSETPKPQTAAARHLPDYYIRGLETTVTDARGKPSHQLRADTLTHFPDTDNSELEQPDITVLGDNGTARWHATADHGEVEAQQEEILLRGNVQLTQYADSRMELQTQWLRIASARHYAETDAPVTLLNPGSELHGVGMKAYGDEQRLELLSAVRGKYAKP